MSRFDKLLGDVQKVGKAEAPPAESEGKAAKKPAAAKAKPKKESAEDVRSQFWEEQAGPEKVPTIRLNCDIPVDLDEKLAAKARALRVSKSKLVREMITFMLDESST